VSLQESLFDVRGARTVVTGAASGLGLAMAEVMADCGAKVTLADLDGERLERETERLASRGGDVRSRALDVSDEQAVGALFGEVVELDGGVDVAFANAGISLEHGVLAPEGGLGAMDRARWDKVLGVNLNGVIHTLRAAAEPMKDQRGGRIVVTASTAGIRADPLVGYSYTATKFAVVGIVHQAALELAPYGVHVNAIAPGPFRTRIGGETEIPDSFWEQVVAIGRMAEPDELKPLALLLASPASSFITGAVIPIDGGQRLMAPNPQLS
jgi:NAD(P)-dependent dehydrogenase (short-subunit alcohol dehydrogenase family)